MKHPAGRWKSWRESHADHDDDDCNNNNDNNNNNNDNDHKYSNHVNSYLGSIHHLVMKVISNYFPLFNKKFILFS